PPENVEGTSTVTPHGERSCGVEGRSRGHGTTGDGISRRGDTETRSVVNSGADVSEKETPVLRSMGMEKGQVIFFLGEEEGTGRNTSPPPALLSTDTNKSKTLFS
ncbi:hypothetical protein GOODEAATRI_027062, partial [Goodea atripinnis]